MRTLLWVTAAGAAGTAARYGVGGLAYRLVGTRFPWGTLAVNVLGSLLVGLVMYVGLHSDLLTPTVRTAVAVGFLGAFTTFATFSYETMRLVEDGALSPALWNIAANLFLGLAAVWVGLVLGRMLMGGS